ncbi:DUF3572 domain-containing protein [Pseudemcibacter aquimaris]|uniref:DUF3572 domain-containing protein n=1 Tax=Pseudemcibacter aquimaris TaxID=2857064 RepID=UPI002013BB58|nr:DUF3572 domain-containing protein [Pseudemcibacter aquimaris]MCC3860487.1 DUF3572 domain-containing protein [Pseudemcibacter aquimaris]WDU59312.1 DUF3572 domain-containing protein [Pseudemcibacter aquimaris]
MDHDNAEILAINALSFVASDEKLLSGYLKLSGTSLEDLKSDMGNPERFNALLGSILDYLMQNENALIGYAEEYNIDPTNISAARGAFPGAMPFQS